MTRIVATTKILIFNDKKELLLLKIGVHTKQPERSHSLDFPGGFVDEGETEYAGALREVMEETGIVLGNDSIELVFGMTDYHDERDVSVTHLLYLVKLDHTPEVVVSWEHESFEWVEFDSVLERDLRPRYRTFIEYVQQYGLTA